MNLVFALTFAVFLDGEPVGSHRFELTEQDGERRLSSVARFDVKLLGVPVYRYRHEATEQWRGDCLARITSRTVDGSETFAVDQMPEGCAMSYAYWNRRILEQKALLNSQTGKLEPVRVDSLGEGRYRISGARYPIELRYSPQGEWLALESIVAGGRRLSYRLQ